MRPQWISLQRYVLYLEEQRKLGEEVIWRQFQEYVLWTTCSSFLTCCTAAGQLNLYFQQISLGVAWNLALEQLSQEGGGAVN